MKKAVSKAIVLVTTMVLAAAMLVAGCKGPEPGGSVVKIGIMQIIAHNALDAAREGFVQALADGGYNDGKEISIDFHDAMGDISNLSTITDRFVNDGVDLVLAIATPTAQAMAAKTDTIPIVATAVTSFTEVGLIESDERPGTNITGTSDMNPVAAQIALIKELVPDAETIGFIYNSGESNSIIQIDIAKAETEALGLEWTEVTVTNTNDVQQAMQSLVTKCDAIYAPTDNTVASSMATVGAVAGEAGIPVITGETNMALEGGLASLGIDYYDIGYNAGLMAIEIILGADPAEMPIKYPADGEVVINGAMAETIGYTVPEKYAENVK
jgi:putative ABC transport system substrate-binding protein